MLPPIDETQLASAYSSGQYPKVVEHIIDYLGKFNEYAAAYLDEQSIVNLDHTVEAIVYYLSRPSFNLNREMFGRILGLHTQFTHMVAVSSYGNTENICQSHFRKNSPNIPLMLLAVNRNPSPPPREKFFDLDARLATVWYGQYFVATRSFTSKHVHENLRQHMEFWDKRMPLVPTLTSGYMRCTYVDPTLDKKWRVRFNALVKEAFKNLVIKNTPNKKKMALITGRWSPVNPTYKNRYPLLKALAQKYEIDLIHCGEERSDLDTSLFAAVKPATFKAGSLNLQAFYENDYGLVYYPDIGMNVESRLMSNIRLAPVQVMSNSHPVSTYGSEIDYFLTGKDSESAQSPQR